MVVQTSDMLETSSHEPSVTANQNIKNASWNNGDFSAYVHRVRQEMMDRRDNSPFWHSVKDSAMIPDGYEVWHGESLNYMKLVGPPGTLAGDILRMKKEPPRYDCNLEIIGDTPVDYDEVDPDLEDCSEELAKLPFVTFDAEKHFAKKPTYKQEIRYLLQCRGSPRIVQLLGRTEEGSKYQRDLQFVSVPDDSRFAFV